MAESLRGRVAVVTGVSRRRGIGFAVAGRLAAMGADDVDEVVGELARRSKGKVAHGSADLVDPSAAAEIIESANKSFGHVDILVCNQARSGGDAGLLDLGADQIDGHWQVDARATLLLTQHFARQHDGRDGGRVVWMTSGQQLGPMPGEVAYAAAKAALVGVLPTVADELVSGNILVNAINPGPVNTGYLDPSTADRSDETLARVRAAFPQGRYGEPDDPARLIGWLVSNEGRWVVGQVINSEGGFRRGA